jgi:hypothetical protein
MSSLATLLSSAPHQVHASFEESPQSASLSEIPARGLCAKVQATIAVST